MLFSRVDLEGLSKNHAVTAYTSTTTPRPGPGSHTTLRDATRRQAQARSTRIHADGHVVAIRALPDYDALFGVDFDPRPDLGAVSAEGK